MIFITFLSVILILFLSYWFTKYIGGKSLGIKSSGHMEIVDRLPVSQDKSIVVLRVQQSYYLLSISQNGVGLIKELENVSELDFQTQDAFGGKGEHDFKEVLTQYFSGKKK